MSNHNSFIYDITNAKYSMQLDGIYEPVCLLHSQLLQRIHQSFILKIYSVNRMEEKLTRSKFLKIQASVPKR